MGIAVVDYGTNPKSDASKGTAVKGLTVPEQIYQQWRYFMSMAILVAGIVLFLGSHSVRMLAPRWREQRIAAMGEGPWKGVYSLVSLASLALLIYGFATARGTAPVLYAPPYGMRYLAFLLMAASFISMMVAILPSGKLKPLLKHPMLVAIKIWAVAHLLVNGDLASIILFGSILAWAVWNRIAVKRRGGPLPQPGPVTNDAIAIVSGLAIWALFIWKLHEWLIGVPLVIA